MDVLPHPHINLATVTYLFEGEILHRDSLGSLQAIRPGEINWMTAGRGIAHSERTSPEMRRTGSKVHGLQLWVALPRSHEEAEPEFHHHGADTLPAFERDGARIRILVGTAYGERSPVQIYAPLFYDDVVIPAGGELSIPNELEERAAYLVSGALQCCAESATPGRMLVFMPNTEVRLRAVLDTRVVLIGGAPIDGKRHIWWNFVSSSKNRIEQAKSDWRQGRFARIPGDEVEFVPLPE
jgi:redox-sensitive bicupin YhaK (pirin superfamily)